MMKKLFAVCICCLSFCILAGCSVPNSLQMDLSQGYGENLKLLHLNASSAEKEQRIHAFSEAIRNAEPLTKDYSMFAYYPDYLLQITPWEDGNNLTVIVDVNGEFVDFVYPGPYPEESQTIYRSAFTAKEFLNLIHQA